MGRQFFSETNMSKKTRTKLVHEGNYVADVDVELIEEPDSWSPCLSLEDARKLDEVRTALERGDVESVSKNSRVFSLTRVDA